MSSLGRASASLLVGARCATKVLLAVICASGLLLPPATLWAANNDEEIVYLDGDGVIRVIDPTVPSGTTEVQWSSPTGGWTRMALGDVNADGDFEILAIRNDGDTGILTIFDPVVVGPTARPDRVINGIPWDILYNLVIPGGQFLLIAAGEMNTSLPGQEMVYLYRQPRDQVTNENPYRLVVAEADDAPSSGRAWREAAEWETGNEWTWIATGDLVDSPGDEIALIDDQRGNLSVFEIDNNKEFKRLFRAVYSERAWRKAEIGQVQAGGRSELVTVRAADPPFPSLYVLHEGADTLADLYAEQFAPAPNFVFLADIGGNGDKEMVMVREVEPQYGNRPRLFIRDYGSNDTIFLNDLPLDPDNGYESGAGGDVDGDGADEIAIMRENRIRLFLDPDGSTQSQDFNVATDKKGIAIANLDTNAGGEQELATFGASPRALNVTVVAGAVGEPQAINLSNVATGDPVDYSIELESNATWVSVSASPQQTPATIQVTFDARGVSPGRYTETMVVRSNSEVANQPYEIPLEMTVQAGLSASPASIGVVYDSCTPAPPSSIQQLTVEGTPGVTYTVALAAEAPWVTVTPPAGTIPGVHVVRVDPAQRTADSQSVDLVVAGSSAVLDAAQQRVTVSLLCANSRVFLPIVQR